MSVLLDNDEGSKLVGIVGNEPPECEVDEGTRECLLPGMLLRDAKTEDGLAGFTWLLDLELFN